MFVNTTFIALLTNTGNVHLGIENSHSRFLLLMIPGYTDMLTARTWTFQHVSGVLPAEKGFSWQKTTVAVAQA
jgi:hypothetical protein